MECSPKYSACVEKYMGYLSAIPLKWAEMIACNICNIMCNGSLSCEEITDCQTLTELTSFTVTGRKVCFSYDDEKGIRVKRCFEIPETVNGLEDTDGSCLMTDDVQWGTLTSSEKWQAIIDKFCDCCNPTTTTSTTTTTTEPVCTCGTYSGWYNVGPLSPSRVVTVRSCDEGNPNEEVFFNPGDTIEFCACYYGDDPLEAILDFNGVENITFLGDGCFATTTTTTTSTTTTTTETTTTTTTTTTTSSTTTTTTASLCECHSYNILNEGVEGASGSYQSCVFPYNTIGFVLGPGGSLDVCACLDSVVLIGAVTVTITDNGLC